MDGQADGWTFDGNKFCALYIVSNGSLGNSLPALVSRTNKYLLELLISFDR